MEQHIRERLVGAAVIVVLAVIVIPEFLSGPPAEQETIEQTIILPAGESQEIKSHTIRLDQQKAQDKPPVAKAVVENKPVPAPVARPPDQKPAVTATRTPDTGAGDAKTAVSETRKSAPTVNSNGAWAVQLGSFSSADNAKRLAETIDKMGYKTFITQIEVDGKMHHRVRIGPMASREAAEAIASELQQQGQQAAVVSQP